MSSSPRKRGPITTSACCRQSYGSSFVQHEHSRLWVPARASLGRDDEVEAVNSQFKFQTAKITSHTRPHSRGTNAPEPCMNHSRQTKQRARGMPGARCTRSLACGKKQSTRASSPKVQPRSPGIPHAMVLTAYFVLSSVTGLSCHRRYRWNNPCET